MTKYSHSPMPDYSLSTYSCFFFSDMLLWQHRRWYLRVCVNTCMCMCGLGLSSVLMSRLHFFVHSFAAVPQGEMHWGAQPFTYKEQRLVDVVLIDLGYKHVCGCLGRRNIVTRHMNWQENLSLDGTHTRGGKNPGWNIQSALTEFVFEYKRWH